MDNEDIRQQLLDSPANIQWQLIGIEQHHGIVVPLFALHSQASCGIGEFPDLLPLIEWCHRLGLDVIQLLPLNDTGRDTSPYGALSAFALNPLHLGLSQLPFVDQEPSFQALLQHMQSLSQAQRVNYPAVFQAKDSFLRLYYQSKGAFLQLQQSFLDFKKLHASWLWDYAVYKSLKIKYDWQVWGHWPEHYQTPTQALIDLPSETVAEANYHIFLQYLCFEQLGKVKKSAEAFNILIKGDIPILINRDSADVWRHRELFLMEYAAGAPPDMYAQEGQKWGFPLYNWSALEERGYSWWKERLATALPLYHLYRLDHVVGFFRIWGIPLNEKAKNGHFIPADESVWVKHGESIMRMMLSHSPLLPIGEDLGIIPPAVRKCLETLGICGTKVMRWERNWETDKEFIDPKNYPPISMTTVSTHDSETLQLWWQNNEEEARHFANVYGWNYEPMLSETQRRQILQSSNRSASFFHINLLSEYLALIPGMTWPDPQDERINVPGVISDSNWSYRFRPSVEEIVSHQGLAQAVAECLDGNGRKWTVVDENGQ